MQLLVHSVGGKYFGRFPCMACFVSMPLFGFQCRVHLRFWKYVNKTVWDSMWKLSNVNLIIFSDFYRLGFRSEKIGKNDDLVLRYSIVPHLHSTAKLKNTTWQECETDQLEYWQCLTNLPYVVYFQISYWQTTWVHMEYFFPWTSTHPRLKTIIISW